MIIVYCFEKIKKHNYKERNMKYTYCMFIILQIIIATTNNAMYDNFKFEAEAKNYIRRYTDDNGFDVIEKPFCAAGKKDDAGTVQFWGKKMVSDNPCPDFLELKELDSKDAQELWQELATEHSKKFTSKTQAIVQKN